MKPRAALRQAALPPASFRFCVGRAVRLRFSTFTIFPPVVQSKESSQALGKHVGGDTESVLWQTSRITTKRRS